MKPPKPPRWFWYVSRPNEIFVDLDSNAAISRALSVLRRALLVKRDAKTPLNKLHFESVWLYPSQSKGHAHLIIVLKRPLDVYRRLAWSLWFGSDRLRAAYVLERFRRRYAWGFERYIFNREFGVFGACQDWESELLSAREAYGFRAPNDSCRCEEKHKEKHVTDSCPALQRILGSHRSDDYFPRNRDKKKRARVRFAWGRIPLSNLRQWKGNSKF